MVCFLMETRLDKEGLDNFCGDLPFSNKIVVKNPNSGGGLAMMWKEEVRMDLINYTANHIMMKVHEEEGHGWFLTGFYGWPEASQRGKSWALLNYLKYFVDGPWVCVGDFNAILSSVEKLSRTPPQQRLMDDFREALESANLMDLGFKGYPYTWNNRRPGAANTKQRIDRVVSNVAWRDKFPLSTVTHLSSHASDHIPIILQTKSAAKWRPKGCHGFKFEESWLLWEDCESVIKGAWEKASVEATTMVVAKRKIEVCGANLLAWGSTKTHPIQRRLRDSRKRLKSLIVQTILKEIKQNFWRLARS